jgi:hypothetical protein
MNTDLIIMVCLVVTAFNLTIIVGLRIVGYAFRLEE